MPRSAGLRKNPGLQTVPRAQRYARPAIAFRSTMNRGELYYCWPSRWDRSVAPASLRDCLRLATMFFFNSRTEKIVAPAAGHAIPTMYMFREFVVAGGLISYGTSLIEEYRQVGLYTGRMLQGESPPHRRKTAL